ncbi:hypothetical protein AB0D74_48830 [Streptomyces sp. NPDC048278]
MNRAPAETGCAYGRAEDIHLDVRPEETKACMLVLIGVLASGED